MVPARSWLCRALIPAGRSPLDALPGDPYSCPAVATFRRLSDGARFVLTAQSMIGRSRACAIRLDDPYVSSEHAKVVWTGTTWRIRDLGSRNGTFVDGCRIEPGRGVTIRQGATLGFGEAEEGWEVVEAGPPRPIATDVALGLVRAAEGEILALPDDHHPELTIYRAAGSAVWVAQEADGETRPITDQAVVTAAGRRFRLDLPSLMEVTPMVDVALTLDNVSLSMAVSSDEERVEIRVLLRGVEKARLEPREHSYLLLTLARARLQDADAAPADRGWRKVDELLRMLKIDQNTLNVSTHRARQHLSSTGLDGAASIVETRRGQRRFGTDRVQIVRLEE